MYKLVWHKNLDAEKWQKFSLEKQILMVANELNRAINLTHRPNSRQEVVFCLERALELVDLTINNQSSSSLRRELFRWRDLLAEEYLSSVNSQLKPLLAVLLTLNSAAYRLFN